MAAASAVSVLVIDCTTTGWADPTGTVRTRHVTVARRRAKGDGSETVGAALLACVAKSATGRINGGMAGKLAGEGDGYTTPRLPPRALLR
ncbi:hypothetical protein tb265_13200 [Gemmatimonadetes bacterium T265]|nr:hypothetical protein tb265_13200 [Gemmatimonadetes bacterium T265]